MAASLPLKLMAAALNIGVEAVVQNDSFVSLGGDSMTALRFSMECRRHKIFIPADVVLSSSSIVQLLQKCRPLIKTAAQPEASVNGPVDSRMVRSNKRNRKDSIDSLSHMSELPPNKRLERLTPPESPVNMLEFSLARQQGLRLVAMETENLCHSSNNIIHKMSDTQIALVHGSVESPSTNIIYYSETHCPAYVAYLKDAWKQVCKTEPIFTTTYCNPGDGQPIRPQLRWRELSTSNWEVYQGAKQAASGPGLPWSDEADDAAAGAAPSFLAVRFTELRYEAPSLADSQTTLIWAVHHALVDGWSAELLVNKVHLAASGVSIQSGPSFTDVCSAQHQLRLSRKAEGDLFWAEQREKLATARDELLLEEPPTAELTGVAGSSPNSDEETHIAIGLSPEEHASLKAAAQACDVTTAAFFYAAWAMCLSLYTDSDNVVVGTVVSGRNASLPGVFEAVGPMINMLPLQVDVCWENPARELVQNVYRRMQRLSQYSWTTPDNGFARVRGNLMAITPDVQRWSEGSSTKMGPSFFKHTTNLPLSAVVQDDGSSMALQYASQHYTRSAIETLAGLFKASLLSLCQTEATLESANLVANTCMDILSTVGNLRSGATTISSITEDLVTLFERTTAEHGSSSALECGEQKMTYAELESRSGEVARTLTGLIEPEEVVAVHADGSINWIIAIYGILRAGGVYCPLDKAHPQHYRDSLFESSTARLFLATNAAALSARPATAATALNIEAILEDSSLSSAIGIAARAYPRPQDRAYLCFTSGSTGKPKGVMCTHQGLVAFQSDLEVRLFASVGIKVAQTMSVAFDGAIHELFSALSYGATLVLRPAGGVAGLSHLKSVDSAILTPSLASALDPDDFPRLKTVYLVGEIVPQTVCDTWAASKALYNMYGPTEATCGATIKRLYPGQPVTIGHANPTTRIYILDHQQRLAPPGRVGEIYLAGVQVAQGYIGRPDVTAERFLPDPFCGSGQEFMYKTGDRGHWNEAGEIVFSGRADRQIKLRGFRIDLEDLEARILRACSEKYGASAVAITNRSDDLVCMIQSTSTDMAGMQHAIRETIPAFAMPRYVSISHRLPMTPNMKVDYRAIAEQATERAIIGEEKSRQGRQEQLDAIKTKTEALIAEVWSQVLDAAVTTAEISPGSSFSRLGGHSLQQLRLVTRLKAMFGPQITMRMIANMPTLRDLASAIDRIDVTPSPSVSDSGSQLSLGLGHSDPWPMEKEWWQRGSLNRGSSAFNVTWVAHYDSHVVSPSRMAEAWNTVLARHAMFRARYVQDHRRGLQRVIDPSAPRVERRRDGDLDVGTEVNRPFDLAAAAPVRVVMTCNTIVAVWSHIVCDYTTLSLVLNEVAAVYHGATLPPPTPPCYVRAPPDALCLDFWSQYLGDAVHRRSAYLGRNIKRTSYGGRSLMGRVAVPLWHRVQAHARQSGVTLQQLLVAAVALAVGTEKQEDDHDGDHKRLDVTLGTPFINRHSEEDMKAVGLFLEPLPVRVDHHDETSSLDTYVAGVQASAQRALSHAVPWNQLLEHLGVDTRAQLPNHPLFDCVASFHDPRGSANQQNQSQEGGGPWSNVAWGTGVEPQLVWSDGAKFKLMVECLAYDDDTLLLRLEYDEDCFGSEDDGRIAAVRRMILTALDAIASREACVLGDVRRELRALWRAEKDSAFMRENNKETTLLEDSRDLFLRRFSQLNS